MTNKCKNCGYRLSLAGKLINKIKIYYCKKCGWRGIIKYV